MGSFIVKRLLLTIPVILGVSIAAFMMSHLVPGDPVSMMLGETATAEDTARLREELGFNDPIAVQYFRYISGAVQGDLGTSIRSGQPVMNEILERFPSTLQLTLVAIVLAAGIGIPLGVIAAVRGAGWSDTTIMGFAMLGISMPTFWSGILLILLFSLKLGWFPVTGSGPMALVLPSIALAAPSAAVLARMTRSSVLEVAQLDYVQTARAKGLVERMVVYSHVLRNAMIPVLTIIGLQFGGLLSGSVIVESVFTRPGLGRYTITAIQSRDFPQIQGIVIFVAFIYVFVNLAIDIFYSVIDPRIRISQ